MTRSPSEVFTEQLQLVRNRRGMTQQALADQMEKLGSPIDRSTIGKIEAGKRGVSIDEALAFAVALGVPPSSLLIPRSGSELVALAPAAAVSGWNALQWWRGHFPLGLDDEPTQAEIEAAYRPFREEVPDYEAAAMRRYPGVHHLWNAANLAVTYASDPETLPALVRVLGYMLEDVELELRRAEREHATSTEED